MWQPRLLSGVQGQSRPWRDIACASRRTEPSTLTFPILPFSCARRMSSCFHDNRITRRIGGGRVSLVLVDSRGLLS